MAYPLVASEAETLRRVLGGESLARYGDGEFNLCAGLGIPCQKHSPELQARLRGILQDSGDCLVGIPNLRSETPKAGFWARYQYTPFLANRPYGSAFISRPDSAPWIDDDDYWQSLEHLWSGKDVTLVRSDSWKALQPSDLASARSVRQVFAPKRDAFTDYDEILWAVLSLHPLGIPYGPVLLCLGPTATVLAVDLCAKGVQAVDIGHVGMFLRKHRRGEPMPLTPAEKARDF